MSRSARFLAAVAICSFFAGSDSQLIGVSGIDASGLNVDASRLITVGDVNALATAAAVPVPAPAPAPSSRRLAVGGSRGLRQLVDVSKIDASNANVDASKLITLGDVNVLAAAAQVPVPAPAPSPATSKSVGASSSSYGGRKLAQLVDGSKLVKLPELPALPNVNLPSNLVNVGDTSIFSAKDTGNTEGSGRKLAQLVDGSKLVKLPELPALPNANLPSNLVNVGDTSIFSAKNTGNTEGSGRKLSQLVDGSKLVKLPELPALPNVNLPSNLVNVGDTSIFSAQNTGNTQDSG